MALSRSPWRRVYIGPCDHIWGIGLSGEVPHMSCTCVCACSKGNCSLPYSISYTLHQRLNCGAGLSRNKGLYRLLHALQLTFYTGFRKIPMVAVLHLMGERQTQLTPRWFPGCRREIPGINGGVDNRTLSVPP